MGSSCFSRSNRSNLQVIQDYLAELNLKDNVEVSGTLCTGECGKGPNIEINGTWFHEVTEPVLVDLLKENLK